MPTPLIQAALDVQIRAHAPYSDYHVGAAIEDENGRIHAGCNVENISYGGTICAERSAITRMVAEGGSQVKRVAVVTPDGGTPCGICRQVLFEFSPDPTQTMVDIVRSDEPETYTTISLAELLPFAFNSARVARTRSGK